jgi:Zn-dependent peptidase ImmA (M78 family)
MRKLYAKKIDSKATSLLRELNLYSAPVDVAAVAQALSADVVYEVLEDDTSGFLLREDGVSTIAINSRHHPNRQRFTLAHECGHLHLHADKGDRLWLDKTSLFFRDENSSTGDQFAEIEANQFAAGLLMPEALIMKAVGGSIEEVDIVRLALKFEVSERAMTVRLVSLGLIESVAS